MSGARVAISVSSRSRPASTPSISRSAKSRASSVSSHLVELPLAHFHDRVPHEVHFKKHLQHGLARAALLLRVLTLRPVGAPLLLNGS